MSNLIKKLSLSLVFVLSFGMNAQAGGLAKSGEFSGAPRIVLAAVYFK